MRRELKMVSATSLERERVEAAERERIERVVDEFPKRLAKAFERIGKAAGGQCPLDEPNGDVTIAGALKMLEGELAQLQDEVYALNKALALVSVQADIVAKDESLDAAKSPDPREVADIPHDIAAKANWIHGLRAFLNDMNNRLRIQ